jgi:hypothetical protein
MNPGPSVFDEHARRFFRLTIVPRERLTDLAISAQSSTMK